jgi:hypothetical protein
VELPFAWHNGSTIKAKFSDLELASSIVDLSAMSPQKISVLRDGVERTIREKARGCISLAGLRILFSQGGLIPLERNIFWDAPLVQVEAENSRKITAVPPERHVFRPIA